MTMLIWRRMSITFNRILHVYLSNAYTKGPRGSSHTFSIHDRVCHQFLSFVLLLEGGLVLFTTNNEHVCQRPWPVNGFRRPASFRALFVA